MRGTAMKLALVLLLSAAPLFAQSETDLIREGIALFDRGRIDESIAKYREVLAKNPSNVTAIHELAMAYTMKRDYPACRALVEPALALPAGNLGAALYTDLGNCLDAAGEPQKAVDVYRKGLMIAPDDARLSFNLAITLAAQNKLDEARQLFEQDVAAQPEHASGHFSLAKVFEAQNFRVPALLEYLRFLAIEPSGARAKFAAQRAVTLMSLGVEKKGRKQINITIDSNSRKEEGDFGSMEMMLGLLAASGGISAEKTSDPAGQLSGQVASFIAMIAETPANSRGQQYVWQTVVPFFDTMLARELTTPFAYVAFSSLELPGAKKWMDANRAAVDRYDEWRSHSDRVQGIPMPPKP